MDNFDEYLRQGEPNKAEKARLWKTAIGLQQVDGLTPLAILLKLPERILKAVSASKRLNSVSAVIKAAIGEYGSV